MSPLLTYVMFYLEKLAYPVFYIILAHQIIVQAAISCLNQDNEPVDWYLIYKLPDINENPNPLIQKGLGFLYTDPNSNGWHLSAKSINDTDQAVAYTVKQIYDTKSSDKIYRLMHNDDPPGEGKNSYRGHTKGVQLFDKDSGFWLIHSVPRFPDNKTYYYPNSGTRFGQSMLCITFETSQVLEEIAQQLFLYQPFIYDSNLPARMAQQYPLLAKVIAGKSARKQPFNRRTTMTSKGGRAFTSFAKHRKWGKDLYADFVAPSLRESIYVESWLNGPGDLPSVCEQKFQVHNLRTVNPNSITFNSSKDHSKWVVTLSSKDPWVCIGDINRQVKTLIGLVQGV